MKKKLFLVLVAVFTVSMGKAFAQMQVYTASNKLLRNLEATNPKAGSLTFYNHLDFNTITGAYNSGTTSQVAQWVARNSMHLDYSITNKFLVSVNALVYQDIQHLNKASNTPDNITLSAKLAGYSFANELFYVGGLFTLLVPTAKSYNSWGNPYSAGGTEMGVNFLISYYGDNLFQKESFNTNLNIGVYNFFDNGKNISNTDKATFTSNTNTTALTYSLGFKYPTTSVDFILELWGWAYVTQPPVFAYTRENLAFLSAGLRMKPVDFINLSIGFDYTLSGADFASDKTEYGSAGSKSIFIQPRPATSPQNYVSWRAIIGLQVNLLPIGIFSSTTAEPTSADFVPQQGSSDLIIRRLEDIGGDKEVTARKIDEIQRRRQDIEKNLQQLRQILKDSEQQGTAAPGTDSQGK